MEPRDGSRQFWLLVLVVVLVSILLRYPRFPDEFGGDTLSLHWDAQTLVNRGSQPTAFSFLSWMGLTPSSYPQGVPLLAATLASFAGIPIGSALMIAGVVTGIAGVMSVLALALCLSRSAVVGLMAAAVIATSAYHVTQTTWGLSGRALVISLFPLAVLHLIRPHATSDRRVFISRRASLTSFVALQLAMATSHRLFFLILATEVLLWVGLVIGRAALASLPVRFRVGPSLRLTTLVLAAPILLYGASSVRPALRQGPGFLTPLLLTNESLLFLVGVLLEFAWDMGPLVVLAATGISVRATRPARWNVERSALVLLFSYQIFALPPAFAVVTLSFVAALIAGEGCEEVLHWAATGRLRRLVGGSVAIGMALLSVWFYSVLVLETQTSHRNIDGTSFYLDQESNEASLFIRNDLGSQVFASPDQADSRRVSIAGHLGTLATEGTLIGVEPGIMQRLQMSSAIDPALGIFDAQFYFQSAELITESKTVVLAGDWIIPGGGYGLGQHWNEVIRVGPYAGKILDTYGIRHVVLNAERSSSTLSYFVQSHFYVEYANSLHVVISPQVQNGCLVGQVRCP